MAESRADSLTATPAGRYVVALLLVLGAWLAYAGVGRVPFLFDDHPAIERNASIRALHTAWRPPVTAAGAAGRPVVNLSLAINYAIGGLEPRGYHWLNVALHALVALALWGVVRRTLLRVESLRAASEPTAATAALLWTVHPLATESVVCVVQRNEILVAWFFLLTLYAFIRSTAASPRSGAWSAAAWCCCALGMASKEVMAGAPLLILLYDRTFVAGSFAGAWRARWRIHLALASTWLLLAYLVSAHDQRGGTAGFGLGLSPWSYALTQCRALVLYLKLAVWPAPLVADYGLATAPHLGAVLPQAILVLALLAATAWAVVRRPAAGFAGACFFVLLAPSSSFIPLTTQTIAEHRMYLPLAAVVVLLAAGARPLLSRRAGLAAAGALALVLGAATHARVAVYQDEETLWRDTIAKAPDNPRAEASLANVLVRARRGPEALACFEAALRLRPDYADAQNDYGNALLRSGRVTDALIHYREARRLKPADDEIRYNLGVALARSGDLPGAIDQLRAVVAHQPRHAAAQNNLGDALLQTGATREALQAFEAAAAADPQSAAAWNNAGIALVRLGRYAEAVTRYEKALLLLPSSAQVHHNLSLALDGAGRGTDAIAHDEAALQLEPNFAAAREHLADLRAARPSAR